MFDEPIGFAEIFIDIILWAGVPLWMGISMMKAGKYKRFYFLSCILIFALLFVFLAGTRLASVLCDDVHSNDSIAYILRFFSFAMLEQVLLVFVLSFVNFFTRPNWKLVLVSIAMIIICSLNGLLSYVITHLGKTGG